MDQQPKSIWKKSFTGRIAWVTWLAVAVFTIMLGSFILALCNYHRSMSDWLIAIGILAGVLLAVILFSIYVLWPLLRYVSWPLLRLLVFKHWRRTLFGLACFATLIALFYAEEDWRGWHDWNQFKQKCAAQGEKLDWQSIVPPPVPDDQNFAFSPVWIAAEKNTFHSDLEKAKVWYGNRIYSNEVAKFFRLQPVQLSGLVGTNEQLYYTTTPDVSGDWKTARLTDLKPWQSYYREMETTNPAAHIPITPQPQSPAADVLLALSKYDPVIHQLRKDSARPFSRFPISYNDENKAAILLPHLAAIKRCAQVVELRAIAELQNGQTEKALADIKLLMRLTESIRTEPFLISQLVRIATWQLALQPIYEGLAEHQWTDAQLVKLNAELAKLDFLAAYQQSIRGETGFQSGLFDYMRHHRREIFNLFANIYDDNHQSRKGSWLAEWIPSGWFYQNQLRCARIMIKYYLPAANLKDGTVSPAVIRNAKKSYELETKSTTPYNVIERMLIPAMGNAARKFAQAQASVDLARVAIALERYRLAQGAYPESLDVLAPNFIAKLPHDVIGGQPLHYRRTKDGLFVLYSVGWNETDDGGVVAYQKNSKTPRVDPNEGDWVWQYPAK